MEKNINLKYPKYFKEFECIGGSCEDSCCIGWDIDIDKESFRRYHKVKNEEMKTMFRKYVHNNDEYTSTEIDYGKVKLKGEKRCPFLDECNYCIIYSNLGEDYLSNVCTHFPRVLNKIDGELEISLDISCPEAARIILNKEEGIEFTQNAENLKKYIVSGDINTKSKECKETPFMYFKEIRKVCIDIIKDRTYDLDTRMYILGDFLEKLEEICENDINQALDFINNYDVKEISESFEKSNMNFLLQVSFFKNLLDMVTEMDNKVFKEHTKEVLKGLNVQNEDYISENAQRYIGAFEEYDDKFIKKYNYIFENYIVNFMYNNLFPFSESVSMFEGYIMILIRYSFMRFYLVSKYLYNKEDSKEKIIKFVQVFSKAIEHDKNYLSQVLDYIIDNGYDNMEFAKTLL